MSLSLTDKSNSFNNNITLLDISNLIIIEKNNLIYLALNLQIADLQLKNPQLKVHSFHDINLFENWFSNVDEKKHYYLFINGNELSHEEIDVAIALNKQSCNLVVFYNNQSDIAETLSNKVNCSLVPFDTASEINIQVCNENPDYIFIDDNKTLCRAWKLKADFSNKTVLCFNTVAEFQNIMGLISPQTPIYIDSNLGNDELGEYESKKLYDAGFHTIFLATGKYNLNVMKPHWIQAVVNKAPPF